MLQESEDDFVATWSLDCEENMNHLTVREFIEGWEPGLLSRRRGPGYVALKGSDCAHDLAEP